MAKSRYYLVEHGNKEEKTVEGVKFFYCECGKRFANRPNSNNKLSGSGKRERHIMLARSKQDNVPAMHLIWSIG